MPLIETLTGTLKGPRSKGRYVGTLDPWDWEAFGLSDFGLLLAWTQRSHYPLIKEYTLGFHRDLEGFGV